MNRWLNNNRIIDRDGATQNIVIFFVRIIVVKHNIFGELDQFLIKMS